MLTELAKRALLALTEAHNRVLVSILRAQVRDGPRIIRQRVHLHQRLQLTRTATEQRHGAELVALGLDGGGVGSEGATVCLACEVVALTVSEGHEVGRGVQVVETARQHGAEDHTPIVTRIGRIASDHDIVVLAHVWLGKSQWIVIKFGYSCLSRE